MEFYLVYAGRFHKNVDDLSPNEMRLFYTLLCEQKKKEQKAAEAQAQKAKRRI